MTKLDTNLSAAPYWPFYAQYFQHQTCWLCSLQNNWPCTIAGVSIIGREPRQVLLKPAERAIPFIDSLFLSCHVCAKHWIVAAVMPLVDQCIHGDTLIIPNPFFVAANIAATKHHDYPP